MLLETIEFIHDPAWLMQTVKKAADHLIMTYRVPDGTAMAVRRTAGYFNDFTTEQLRELLEAAGWMEIELQTAAPYTIVTAK